MLLFYLYINLFLLFNYYYSLIISTEIKEEVKDLAIMVVMMAAKGVWVVAFLSHGPTACMQPTVLHPTTNINLAVAWPPGWYQSRPASVTAGRRHGGWTFLLVTAVAQSLQQACTTILPDPDQHFAPPPSSSQPPGSALSPALHCLIWSCQSNREGRI